MSAMGINIIYRILPEETGEEIIEEIIEELARKADELNFKILDYKKEAVAFGLFSLLLLIEVEEREGILEDIEAAIASTKGVSTLDVIKLTRT